MSGSMSAPMGAQPGMGQIPPQLLAMLMQAQQRQGQGPMQQQVQGPMQAQMPQPQPPGQPMGAPQAPQGMPMVPQAAAPQGAPQAGQAPLQGIPAPMPGGMSNSYAAAKGRFGDSTMAHMTPGEIAVPPQLQTPQVLQTLASAFKQAGVSPQQFTAGSPFASTNPQTGNQEFSLWSAILPVLGAVGGSFIPGIGTAAGAALGGGLGGAAGGAIDKTGIGGILGGAAGGALGGYMGQGGGLASLLGGGASGAASGATDAATTAATNAPLGSPTGAAGQTAMAARMAAGDSPAMIGAGTMPQVAAPSPTLGSMLKTGGMAGLGASLGSGLGQSFNPATGSNTPPGFGDHMPPPNPNMIVGGRPAGQMPTFTGYNPYTAVTGSPYNFFPTS